MAEPGVQLVAGVSAVAALAWLTLGLRLARRPLPRGHRAAGRAFAFAWFAASAYAALGALFAFASATEPLPPAIALGAGWTSVVLASAMATGLVAYLVHLLTGDRRAVPIVIAAFVLLTTVLLALLASLKPYDAFATGSTVRFHFEAASPSTNAAIALLLIVPIAFFSAAYLALARRAPHATARWRILLVGGGLSLWSATAILARVPAAPSGALGVARLMGGVAALATLLAYAPPGWARARWGVQAPSSEVVRVPPTAQERSAREAALQARLSDLV